MLKGQSHGRPEIFEGLKMTFRTKILLISIKNTTKFALTTFLYDDFFFDSALDRSQVNCGLSSSCDHQINPPMIITHFPFYMY